MKRQDDQAEDPPSGRGSTALSRAPRRRHCGVQISHHTGIKFLGARPSRSVGLRVLSVLKADRVEEEDIN